jgi:hypothetical protein
MPISFASLGGASLPLAEDAALQLLTNSDPTSLNAYFSETKNQLGLISLISGPQWSALEYRANTMSRIIASSNALNAIVDSRTAMTAIAASQTSMNTVAASATAMTAIAAKETAMTPIAANSIAMTPIVANANAMNTIAASNTAMSAVFSSSTARLLMFNSALAETAFRTTSNSLNYISSNFGTNVSGGGNANAWAVLSTAKVLVISANVGWITSGSSRQARYFRHIQSGITGSTMAVSNTPFAGDGNWPLLEGRMMDRLELITYSDTTNAVTRSARIVVMG